MQIEYGGKRERSGTERRGTAEMGVRVEEEVVRRGEELRHNIIHHGVTLVSSAQRCQNLSVAWKDDKQ